MLLPRLEQQLESAPLVRYSERAGIRGLERALTVAYLDYCWQVLRQTEGLQEIKVLADAARQRWLK